MMASAEEVFSGSRFHKVVKSTMKMPFPLRIRECIIDGKGYDVMEHNRVVISSHSISEHPKVNIGKCPEDRVRVDISVGGFKLIPVGNKRTHVTVMFNLNPHIPYLPSRIANFFLRHVVNQIHSSMEKHSTFKKDSPYLQCMAEKADLYNYIESRYEETRKSRKSGTFGK